MIKILDRATLHRIGVIKHVLSSNRVEGINGENTLDFTAVLESGITQLITPTSVFELAEDFFDVAFMKKTANEDGTYSIEIQAEHVSYRLNNPTFNRKTFNQVGTPPAIIDEILEGTGFSRGNIEFLLPTDYIVQEETSRRQLLFDFVTKLEGELIFNKFEISVVLKRGSRDVKLAIKDTNVKVISQSIDNHKKDKDGNSIIVYQCSPIFLKEFSYALGDDVHLIQSELNVSESLRIVHLNYNPYDPTDILIQFSNSSTGLENTIHNFQSSTVAKEKSYYGVRFGGRDGFKIEREDGTSRVILNSDTFMMEVLKETLAQMTMNTDGLVIKSLINGILTERVRLGRLPDGFNRFGLQINGINESVILDEFGLSPDFIKRFPNKIVNSSFEQYDVVDGATTERPGFPRYWSGQGICAIVSAFDGDMSLELAPGQMIEQGWVSPWEHAGADPAWWNHEQTRFSFRQNGSKVRVWVRRVLNNHEYLLTDNSELTTIKNGPFLDYDATPGWHEGLRSFFYQPVVGDGKVKICFQNIGTSNVYLDAVQIEPDFTKRWPSFYTNGPRSIGEGEVGIVDWPSWAISVDSSPNSAITLTRPAEANRVHVITGFEAIISGAAAGTDIPVQVFTGTTLRWKSFIGASSVRGSRTGLTSAKKVSNVNTAVSITAPAAGAGCIVTLNLMGYTRTA